MTDADDFRASLKSLDTEEHIDIYFYRRLGFFWARLARRLGVTPNAITIASIFIGVAAGVLLYPTNLWVNICGLLLLVLANSFDSADGQLARLTGQYSPLGRILDGLAGDFWFLAIYLAIALRTVGTVGWFAGHPWAMWTLTILAGLSHGVQAAVADRCRQIHLFAIGARSELDDSATVRARLREKPSLYLRGYLVYTRLQELLTPAACRMLAKGQLPADFRARSLPLMKYANALTFNWRSIVLALATLAGAPWLFPLAEVTLGNLLLALLLARHSRACRP